MPKSLFTTNHHKAIARVINDSRLPKVNLITATSEPDISPYWLVKMFVAMLRQDNPKLDEEAFRIACGEQPAHSD